jgi:hypothetical protein
LLIWNLQDAKSCRMWWVSSHRLHFLHIQNHFCDVWCCSTFGVLLQDILQQLHQTYAVPCVLLQVMLQIFLCRMT